MTAGTKQVWWTTGAGILGAAAGAVIGIALDFPGLGPTGVGLVIGAAVGYVIGLPREERE